MHTLPDHSGRTISTPENTDEELMQAIIARNQDALDRIHARYRPLINKIVMEILPNEADAAEAMQDVFVEIWNRASNYDVRKGKPLGWIICMARRRAIDHYRKIRRRAEANEKLRLESDDENGTAATDCLTQHRYGDQADIGDLRRFLEDIINHLPEEQGRVIRLSYFKQLSQREIAAHTGIPLGTIKTRLDLGLRKLTQRTLPLRRELLGLN